MKDKIKETLKSCETCEIYNRKRKSGCEFISTTRFKEKMAVDLIDIRTEGKYVIIMIDYFSRIAWQR